MPALILIWNYVESKTEKQSELESDTNSSLLSRCFYILDFLSFFRKFIDFSFKVTTGFANITRTTSCANKFMN